MTSDNASADKNSKSESPKEDGPKTAPNPSSAGGKPETYGYDLYPERRGEKYKRSWLRTIVGLEGREQMQKIRCEKNVYECIRNSPQVKLMMAALKSSGCPVDIRRHISCEICDSSVSGGYDTELNQIVVCQNNSKDKSFVEGILTHEMIHMFDYCRNNLDFKNIDHLACTEIRAANLTHCTFLSSLTQGDTKFRNIRATHQDCVKTKALWSVMTARSSVTEEQARESIIRVFPKCYPDMEPIGRRPRARSNNMFRAYLEGPILRVPRYVHLTGWCFPHLGHLNFDVVHRAEARWRWMFTFQPLGLPGYAGDCRTARDNLSLSNDGLKSMCNTVVGNKNTFIILHPFSVDRRVPKRRDIERQDIPRNGLRHIFVALTWTPCTRYTTPIIRTRASSTQSPIVRFSSSHVERIIASVDSTSTSSFPNGLEKR